MRPLKLKKKFLNKKLHSFPSKSSEVESGTRIAAGLKRGFLRSAAAPAPQTAIQCKY